MSSVPPPRVSPSPMPPPVPPDPPAEHREEVPWPIWTAPVAVLTGLVVGVIGSVVVLGIGTATGGNKNSPAVNLVSDLVFDVGFVLTALYFASRQGRPRPADFGYRRIAVSLGIGAFLAGGIGYYVVTAAYQSLVHLHGTDKLPQSLGVGNSTVALAAAGVFVCVVAPIAEEFFFRGFIFGALRRWRVTIRGRDVGTWLAAVLTGILFGLAHTGSAAAQYLVPLGFLGFVLCLVRWKTGSLYPCMALHSANNALALGVNQLHWNAGEIFALLAASITVVGAITLPLSWRAPAAAS
ncbi:MAG: CPBP family intramembrane metalloprotease [Solirubrobacterales bacterium]|nr:CPBP family intramembrane metalloprotease [Solirubrobacterales bacterium]